MGSKGSGAKKESTTEAYTADPRTAALAEQVGIAAGNLPGAGAVPLQGVAGFDPYQTSALQAIYGTGMQNPANPYFASAQQMVQQSAAPLDTGAIGDLYGQLSAPVFASMQDVFGQQRAQNTGNLIQQAGGGGHSRVGIGEAELAKQQGLAAGQTGSGLLGQAIQTYMNQRGLQQSGGALMGNLGQGVLGSQLQGYGAALGAGNQQQQQQQNILNALFAQQQGQYQNPYQNLAAQSGAMGAMGSALGGTKAGTKETTLPETSMMPGILGLAGTVAGGMFGGPLGASIGGQLGGMAGGAMSGGGSGGGGKGGGKGGSASGGRVMPMAAGGFVNPFDIGQGFADGGYFADGGALVTPMTPISFMSDRGGQQEQAQPNIFSALAGGAKNFMDTYKKAQIANEGRFGNVGERTMPTTPAPNDSYWAPNPFGGFSPTYAVGGPVGLADGGTPFDRRFTGIQLPPGVPIPKDIELPGMPVIDAPDIVLNEDRLGLNKRPSFSNPAIEADRAYAADPNAAQPFAPVAEAGVNPSTPLSYAAADTGGGGGGGDASGLPALPEVPGKEEPGFAGSPGAALMQAGLGMMAATGARDAQGFPLGGGALGQTLRAAGLGGQQALQYMQEQRKAAREDRRVEMEAQRMLESARMARLPYTQMTAGQKAELEARERPYREMTAAQKAELEARERPYRELTAAQREEVDKANKRLDLDVKKMELEGLKPFKIGTHPQTFVDIYGVRDPKTGDIRAYDPSTGKLMPPGEGIPVAEGGITAGMTPAALDAAADRYLQTGQMPPNTGRGRQGPAQISAIQNRAAQMAEERGIKQEDLPKRWQEFKGQQIAIQRFMSGPQGNTTRSLGVVVDHLGTARELGDALQNGDIRAFNQLATEWAKQTGNPAPTNFDAVKQIIGAEVIKALGVAGAGSVQERQEAGNAFSRASSPAQLRGAIESVQKLLVGQLNGLERQFTQSTGLPKEKFRELLPQEALRFYGVDQKKTGEPEIREGKDGKKYLFKGGDRTKKENWELVQ